MILARLDNGVFFKKAFTDEIVFKAFVKDIIGIEVEPAKIETEKAFQPKLGNITFKYDIFEEDVQRRIVVEIQKVEYDHNFDRFLHYHLQAITEQQRSSEDYSVEKTVYTIVVMTAPYKINTKTNELYKDEVLRDWLDLIYESIHNPENPQINISNEGIKRAAEMVRYENISPEEWEQAKIEASKRKVITLEREEERTETQFAIAKSLLNSPLSDEEIAQYTGLSVAQIKQLRSKNN